jgi:4-hydroxybenzoate polyprenyltransferase
MKEKLFALMLFTRFSALGGTIAMVLLGAGAVAPHPGLSKLCGLIGVGIAFHIYGYVLNDVIDLPVDRSEPRRVDFPLVRGTLSPAAALLIALLQVPLALLLTWWNGGTPPAYAALLASIVCLGIYNLWGKQAFFPPLTDLVQGLGWSGLGLYGAYIAAGHLSAASMVLFTYIVVMILLANGVHGSVRDLDNDFRLGVRSTAILLGARPGLDQAVKLSPALRRYALLLNLLLVGIALGALITGQFGYSRSALLWAFGVEILLSLLSLWILHLVARPEQNRGEMNASGLLHLLILYLMLIVLILPGMDPALSSLVVLLFLLPLLTHSWLYAGIRWVLCKAKLVRRQESKGV